MLLKQDPKTMDTRIISVESFGEVTFVREGSVDIAVISRSKDWFTTPMKS